MSREEKAKPYIDFGNKLKSLREQAKESTAEVAGAVEADTKHINALESGEYQPSEDIVLLLISHFGVKDNDAGKIWRLAGYDQSLTGQISEVSSGVNDLDYQTTNSILDNPIIYTDLVQVNANKYGVVINFMQTMPGFPQPMAVSRVGMSHEHAKSMLEVLRKTIESVEKSTNTPPANIQKAPKVTE